MLPNSHMHRIHVEHTLCASRFSNTSIFIFSKIYGTCYATNDNPLADLFIGFGMKKKNSFKSIENVTVFDYNIEST